MAGGGKHAKARRKALLQQRQIEERSERLRRRQIEADSTGAKRSASRSSATRLRSRRCAGWPP